MIWDEWLKAYVQIEPVITRSTAEYNLSGKKNENIHQVIIRAYRYNMQRPRVIRIEMVSGII